MLYYKWWLSKSSSGVMKSILVFHDLLMMVIVSIAVFVGGLLVAMSTIHSSTMKYTHDEPLEVIWTLLPVFIFLFLAIPSITILFLSENSYNSSNEYVKAMAHQWYWEYEQNFKKEKYSWESFMVPLNALKSGDLLNLEVDKPFLVHLHSNLQVLVTSADVLHSFAMPSWGMKADCVPGRINQCFVYPLEVGVFYGQCSEICGANHSFMPISVEVMKNK